MRYHDHRRSWYLWVMQLVGEALPEPRSLAFVRQEHIEEFVSKARVTIFGQLWPRIEIDVGRVAFDESRPRLVRRCSEARHLNSIRQRQPKIERGYFGA